MIITADDFGYSQDVNAAIVEASERHLITHASVMANMAGFDQACALAPDRELLQIGVHLVLTEGEPLTEPIRRCRRFCDEQGRFRYWRRGDRAFHLSRAERRAVSVELREQVIRCREGGLRIGHLDSHHHVHTKRAIGTIVLELARELGVPRIRLAHNCGPRIGFVNRTYKSWYNRRLQRCGLAQTRWFGSIDDYRHVKSLGLSPAQLNSFEIVTHPIFRDGVLADLSDPKRPLGEFLSIALDRHSV